MVLDSEGVDLWPLVDEAAINTAVPAELLLALCQAESDLTPEAERWGDRTRDAKALIAAGDLTGLSSLVADLRARGLGADVSFGLTQLTYSTAAGYGIGDGLADIYNLLAVRDALFERRLALDVGARHLSGCLSRQDVQEHDRPDLAALIVYNSGWLPPEGHDWYRRWAANVANYEAALAWAHSIVGGA